MKIAILADVHSNIHSLEAVLEDIAAEKPDIVVGAGDMIGCSAYPCAIQTWHILYQHRVPFVLGNHEERILRFHAPHPDPHLTGSVQFMPLQYIARQFSPTDLQVMQTMPENILLPGPLGSDVLICHASPGSLNKSPMQGIDHQMALHIQAVKAGVIVVGHLHNIWHQYWQDKLLVMAGSAGLPLRGKLDEVDYLLLTHTGGAWQFAYKSVRYDAQAAIRASIESDFLQQAGPLGWLMFDESLVQEDRLIPFLHEYCAGKNPDNIDEWKRLVMDYLKQINRWDTLKPYLQPLL